MGFNFQGSRQNTNNQQGSTTGTGQQQQDLGIMKSLSTMGTAAKRNLSQLANRFRSTNNETNQTTSNRAGGKGKNTEMTRLVDADDVSDFISTSVFIKLFCL